MSTTSHKEIDKPNSNRESGNGLEGNAFWALKCASLLGLPILKVKNVNKRNIMKIK
ncbi:jg355, partial [Pararge aegeria aegeria]